MVTAVAVAALLAGARHPRAVGALAGFGALLKVWPVLLLVGAPRGAGHPAVLGRGGAARPCGLTLAFVVPMPGALAFLTFQRDRGTEVESLGALVFHVGPAPRLGGRGAAQLRLGGVPRPVRGAGQHRGAGADRAAFGWLLLWRLRAAGRVARARSRTRRSSPCCCSPTTSRVISPQYMLWLVGLGRRVPGVPREPHGGCPARAGARGHVRHAAGVPRLVLARGGERPLGVRCSSCATACWCAAAAAGLPEPVAATVSEPYRGRERGPGVRTEAQPSSARRYVRQRAVKSSGVMSRTSRRRVLRPRPRRLLVGAHRPVEVRQLLLAPLVGDHPAGQPAALVRLRPARPRRPPKPKSSSSGSRPGSLPALRPRGAVRGRPARRCGPCRGSRPSRRSPRRATAGWPRWCAARVATWVVSWVRTTCRPKSPSTPYASGLTMTRSAGAAPEPPASPVVTAAIPWYPEAGAPSSPAMPLQGLRAPGRRPAPASSPGQASAHGGHRPVGELRVAAQRRAPRPPDAEHEAVRAPHDAHAAPGPTAAAPAFFAGRSEVDVPPSVARGCSVSVRAVVTGALS